MYLTVCVRTFCFFRASFAFMLLIWLAHGTLIASPQISGRAHSDPKPCASMNDPQLDSRYFKPTRPFPDLQPTITESPQLGSPTGNPTVKVVVLGDSVMWGDGLTDPEKFAVLVGRAIANHTSKPVHIDTFAHSGARLLSCEDNSLVPLTANDETAPGDLDSGRPSSYQQSEIAAEANHDGDADLVLLDGCINEIHATDIAFPYFFDFVATDEIARRVHSYCAQNMADTLTSVAKQFPHATILLIGYWRVVSDKSSPWNLGPTGAAGAPSHDAKASRRLLTAASEAEEKRRHKEMDSLFQTADELESHYPVKRIEPPAVVAGTTDEFSGRWQHWADNSTMFLDRTRGCFEWAVASANGEQVPSLSSTLDDPCPVVSSRPGSSSRVYLVPGFDNPDYSYGASQKHLWSVPVKFLFWILRSDDMYRDRVRLCNSHFRGADNARRRFSCSVNATAHPNIQGAETYRDSIVQVLEQAWALKARSGR